MKKVFSYLLTFLMVFSLLTLDAFAFDETITVRFAAAATEQQISEIIEMTDTKIKSKKDKTYVFEFNRIVTKDTLDKYSELFIIIPVVEEVAPLPKDKLADKIDVVYYENKALSNSQEGEINETEETVTVTPNEVIVTEETNKTPVISSNQSGTSTTLRITESRDVYVTFKPGEGERNLQKFNRVFGTRLVEKKGFNSYILKLPSYVPPKLGIRALKLCPYVSSVQATY